MVTGSLNMLYLFQFLFTVMTVWFTHVVVSGIFEAVQKIMHNADCCSGHMALIFNLLMPNYVQEHGLHSSKSDRPSKILRAAMWNGRLGILFGFSKICHMSGLPPFDRNIKKTVSKANPS